MLSEIPDCSNIVENIFSNPTGILVPPAITMSIGSSDLALFPAFSKPCFIPLTVC